MEESSATTWREMWGDVSTTTGGTGSILLSGTFTEIEGLRNFNTATHTSYETVQVAYGIESDIESDEGSNIYMEYYAFVVDD